MISQDIILPLRSKPLGQTAQVVLNRVVNVLVSLFVLFWGRLVRAAGAGLFLSEYNGDFIFGGSVRRVYRGTFLEAGEYGGRILRDDWRGGRVRNVFL